MIEEEADEKSSSFFIFMRIMLKFRQYKRDSESLLFCLNLLMGDL